MARVTFDGLGISLHGKAGNAVFAHTRTGVVLRPRTMPANPRTPAQVAARERLTQAASAFRALTPAERQAWAVYAASLLVYPRDSGAPYAPAANSVFIALASKRLQAVPGAPIPTVPPAAPFFGDNLTLAASAGAGGITFTASAPNAAGVLTELLWQPLVNGGRTPQPRQYRTQRFAAFAAGALSVTLPAAPGWYAAAYRFVREATGQETEVARAGVVEVG